MVASCRLDTLRVVNEFQGELGGGEAWFLHSNPRDKLAVTGTSVSPRQEFATTNMSAQKETASKKLRLAFLLAR